jgi:hypothetical protein
MTEKYTTQRMLALRKLTRAAADLLRNRLKESLSAVAPLLQPKTVLGDYVRGVKDASRGADAVYRGLEVAYQEVAHSKPYGLTRELAPPLDLAGSSVELSPYEYAHSAGEGGQKKRIKVASPFRWVLSYTGYTVEQLHALLASTSPSNEDLHTFVLHYVTLHAMTEKQAALQTFFQALRFGMKTETLPEFGKLPLTCLSGPISTVRPPDDVIVETTELSGSDTFEEVIDLDALRGLRDPLKESLLDLAREHGEKV